MSECGATIVRKVDVYYIVDGFTQRNKVLIACPVGALRGIAEQIIPERDHTTSALPARARGADGVARQDAVAQAVTSPCHMHSASLTTPRIVVFRPVQHLGHVVGRGAAAGVVVAATVIASSVA